MPSPLAHIATGYALYQILRVPGEENNQLLGASVVFSLLPDLDSLIGLAGRDFIRYHNNISHSLGFSVAAGMLSGLLLGRNKKRFGRWFAVGILATGLHLSLDYWATRRGLLLLWPLSSRRFISPARLFYGFRWGAGIRSMTHLWTLLTELLFGLVLLVSANWLANRIKT